MKYSIRTQSGRNPHDLGIAVAKLHNSRTGFAFFLYRGDPLKIVWFTRMKIEIGRIADSKLHDYPEDVRYEIEIKDEGQA